MRSYHSLRLITNQIQCNQLRHHAMPHRFFAAAAAAAHSQHNQQLDRPVIKRRWYGSKTIVEVEEQTIPGMQLIKPYLRSGLKTSDRASTTHARDSEEFVISFLGTGGGSPTQHRLGTCSALRLGGQTFLFDVTEGTLRQLEFSRIMPSSITKIFITHMHGDHLFGLVPMILGIMVSHKLSMGAPRRKRKHNADHGGKATLEIYGPPGLYNYINMVLTLSCSKVNYLNVNVIELVGGRMERGPVRDRGGWQRSSRNAFLSHYPEIETPFITRKYLEKNADNIWVIDDPEPITEKSLEAYMSTAQANNAGFHRLPNDINLGAVRRLHIRAAEIDHLGGVQTFGYTVEEQPPPSNLDMEKAKALGVNPSKKYGMLKCGVSVATDDGTGVVRPEDVLIRSFRPRKVAFLSDHRLIFREMAQLCKNADLLVHESTLSKEDGVDKIKIRGHNTAYNAGVFGKHMGCKVVVLNHFGSASCGKEYVGKMIDEAREGNDNASQIVASHDFLEVWIPRGGFDFSDDKVTADVQAEEATTGLIEQNEM